MPDQPKRAVLAGRYLGGMNGCQLAPVHVHDAEADDREDHAATFSATMKLLKRADSLDADMTEQRRAAPR